jgi:hypothetical protein
MRWFRLSYNYLLCCAFRAKNSSVLWFEKIKFFFENFFKRKGWRERIFAFVFFKRHNEPKASEKDLNNIKWKYRAGGIVSSLLVEGISLSLREHQSDLIHQ